MDNKFDKANYDKEYQRNHKTRLTIWFNNEKDEEIIKWLDGVTMNKSEYIRKLIRTDMNNERKMQ